LKKFKVILTRSKKDGKRWEKILKDKGLEVFCIPVQIYRFNKKDFELKENSIIIFTSTKGIYGFSKIKKDKNFDCVVLGEREEEKAKELGFNVIFKSDFPSSSNFLKKIIENLPRDKKLIYPTSLIYNKEFEEGLKENGFDLDVLILYKPVKRKISKEEKKVIKNSTDIIFFSPSQVNNFFSQIKLDFLKHKNFWAIGEKTYNELKKITNCKKLNKPEPEEFLKEIFGRTYV